MHHKKQQKTPNKQQQISKKQKSIVRSKSVIPVQQQYCQQNLQWAHILKDMSNQHSDDLQKLLPIVKRINIGLNRQVSLMQNRLHKQIHYCQQINNFVSKTNGKQQQCNNINSVQYFLSTLQDIENSIQYYHEQLQKYQERGQYQHYQCQIKQKIEQLGKIYGQKEGQGIKNKNHYDKVKYEYEKGKKTLQALNKQIIAKQIKLRKLEKQANNTVKKSGVK